MLLDTTPPPVITIDGPGGAGKGTISRRLAEILGWHFLDSGAIYRSFAFIAVNTGIPLEEEDLLECLKKQLNMRFMVNSVNKKLKIFWGQQNITQVIRSNKYGQLASQIAAYPKIRIALLDYQRAFRKVPGLVADGRDMGTVVFPDALLKIFLTATLEERAKRRYLQLKERGKHVSLGAVRVELEQRDYQDKQRLVAPLVAAEDAFILDTTKLSIQDVLRFILDKRRVLE